MALDCQPDGQGFLVQHSRYAGPIYRLFGLRVYCLFPELAFVILWRDMYHKKLIFLVLVFTLLFSVASGTASAHAQPGDEKAGYVYTPASRAYENVSGALANQHYTVSNYSGVYYVKPSATGLGDCSSWANACTLQTALTNASSGDEIWAAAGTHKPTSGTDRTISFVLKSGVAVYGGFAGTETARSQRNFETNLTILSGDLLGNDNANVALDEPTRADNSYHVVVGGGIDSVLDGFTITAGNANGEYAFPCDQMCGGGMFNIGSPALANIIFRDNAAHNGGGMFNLAMSGVSKPTLLNVIFSGNVAQGEWGLGGGMTNFGFSGTSSPTLTNVTFGGNLALDGGGMYNVGVNGGEGSPTLNNVTFSGNMATDGGGMFNFSGSDGVSSPVLTEVTFNGNSAEVGGGMYNYGRYDGDSSPILTNVTMISNTAQSGAGMFNLGKDDGKASPRLTNVSFLGNIADFDSAGMVNCGQGGVSSPTLTNVVFSGNVAQWIGGMFNLSIEGGESSPMLTNVTFSGNAASSGSGSSMQNACDPDSTCNPVLINVIMWGNTGAQIYNYQDTVTPTISYSIIQGSGGSQNWNPLLGNDGGHNLDVDPQFIDPIPASESPTTGGNYRLQAGSPAINAGNNAVVPVGATDLDGNPRIFGSAVDIGAYELINEDNKHFVIVVKTDNPGASSGTQFTIPTTGSGYNYNVDCNNDGADEATGVTGNYTCNYASSGIYTIRIKDNSGAGTGFPRIYFNNSGDRLKLNRPGKFINLTYCKKSFTSHSFYRIIMVVIGISWREFER